MADWTKTTCNRVGWLLDSISYVLDLPYKYHRFKRFVTCIAVADVVSALICLGKYGCSSFFYNDDEMSCVPSLSRHFNTTLLDHHQYYIIRPDVIDIEGLPAIAGITRIACALICLRKDGCSSFFYHADEMSCVPSLIRHFNPNGLTSGTGYKYYIFRPECDEGWEVFRGRCYYYESSSMTQQLAKEFCVEMGASLASTNSAAEDVYFRSLTQRGLFWLGGERGAGQTWSWLDGGQFVARWANGQPDDDGACLEQWGTGWNDAYCGASLRPLCEK